MQGVELEAARRNDLSRTWLGLGRNDGFDAAILQRPKHLGICIAGVHRRRRDGRTRRLGNSAETLLYSHALVLFACRHLNVDNHAALVVDRRMLLVGRLQSAVARVGRHRGVGVGYAHFLELAGLPAGAERFDLCVVDLGHRLDMPNRQAVPTDVGADQ